MFPNKIGFGMNYHPWIGQNVITRNKVAGMPQFQLHPQFVLGGHMLDGFGSFLMSLASGFDDCYETLHKQFHEAVIFGVDLTRLADWLEDEFTGRRGCPAWIICRLAKTLRLAHP